MFRIQEATRVAIKIYKNIKVENVKEKKFKKLF